MLLIFQYTQYCHLELCPCYFILVEKFWMTSCFNPCLTLSTANIIYSSVHAFWWASLVAQMVKKLPELQGIWVPSPGWEDPLDKEMTTHSSILAWTISWTEKPCRLQSVHGSCKKSDTTVWWTLFMLFGKRCKHSLYLLTYKIFTK